MNTSYPGHITQRLISWLLPALLVCTPLISAYAQQSPPQVIAYQGLLTDEDGSPVDGNRTFVFRYFDSETTGNQLGTDIVRNSVAVTDGVFSVKLDAAGIDFSRAVWLEIAASDASGENPTALLPRTQLTAVPYAFHAFNGGGSGGGWSLTGNAGLVRGSNFIGTTDRTPLIFRTNNLPGFALVPGGADGDRTPNVLGGEAIMDAGVIGAAVGGGAGNRVGGRYSTVGGGLVNEARASFATIAGGGPADEGTPNRVFDVYGTIGGGGANQVGIDDQDVDNQEYAVVAGGRENQARAEFSAVGGGSINLATGSYSTIGGGRSNEASGLDAKIGGGGFNKASGAGATVPGGLSNEAVGAVSLAAGYHAKALHARTFVWSAGLPTGSEPDFESTSHAQFLIQAHGGVGIRTNAPRTQLHVTASKNSSATVDNHVALIENNALSTSSGPDVLALKTSAALPTGNTNFITFFSGSDGAVGAIEGTASGTGITLKSGGADFAEMLPRLDPAEFISAGDVVGLYSGRVTKRTAGADQVMVVSSRPIVLGNASEETTQDDYEPVAFIGQAEVRVVGPVEAGDLLVASAGEDGRARAVSPRVYDPADHGLVIGRAWTSDLTMEEKRVNAAIGLDQAAALIGMLERQDSRIQRQQERIDQQDSLIANLLLEVAELRQRMVADSAGSSNVSAHR